MLTDGWMEIIWKKLSHGIAKTSMLIWWYRNQPVKFAVLSTSKNSIHIEILTVCSHTSIGGMLSRDFSEGKYFVVCSFKMCPHFFLSSSISWPLICRLWTWRVFIEECHEWHLQNQNLPKNTTAAARPRSSPCVHQNLLELWPTQSTRIHINKQVQL